MLNKFMLKMSASQVSSSWIVASRKGKVASPKGKKQKPFSETMPRIETKLPVEESPTIYSVFAMEEDRKEKAIKNQAASKPGTSTVSSTSVKKNTTAPKKAPEKKEKVRTLEEAIVEVSLSDLEAVLANDKKTFRDHPDVWLKDLVSLFNLKLDKLPVCDPTFSNKPTDYPASLLSKPIKSFLLNTFSQSSTQTLKLFLDHCIDTMITDINKGLPSYGFFIFVQLLLNKMPHIGMSCLPAYLALLKDNINKPQRALCILWCIGQAGISNLGNGLKVWLELMLPVLNIRNLSMYAVQYLECLLRLHVSSKLGSVTTVFSKREFFQLFDELFSSQPVLSNDLRTRMLQMYPKLKVIAFGSQPEATLHNFFPSFLSRCTSDCSEKMKAELLDSLVVCLCSDKQSFSTWINIYVKHLSQSSILLQYLNTKLDSVRSKIDVRLLREAVRAFSVTNEDLLANNKSSSPSDIKRCVITCNELLTRLSGFRVRSHWILISVLFLIGGALVYDIQKNGGVANCWTYRTLLAAGVIDVAQQASKRLSLYANRVLQWMVTYLPAYFNNAVNLMSPYIRFCYSNLLELFSYIMVTLRPHCQSASLYITHSIDWLNSHLPCVMNKLSHFVDLFLQGLVYITVLLQTYLQGGVNWIVANVLTGNWSPENIAQFSSNLVASVQSVASTSYHWVVNLFN